MPNIYEDPKRVEEMTRNGEHRDVIGGLWDEMGVWQFEFCKDRGLNSSDIFLDIGCGSFRGGVHFARYLQPAHYFGVDAHAVLLDAGYERELVPRGLDSRVPRSNLLETQVFEFERFDRKFDFVLAQSVFTHLPLNMISLCLSNLSKVLTDGARFFATFFKVGEDVDLSQSVDRGNGITSRFHSNPYHYRLSDFDRMARDLPFDLFFHDDALHPRGHSIVEFRFTGKPGGVVENSETRSLSPGEALGLRAGADHYRAYVGPPRRFDFMSSTQFALLHSMGLRDEDYVLDVGCGSLRLGRLLIPFLLEGRYFGVDPNGWLIEEGIAKELGRDAISLKKPRFSNTGDFDVSEFGQPFDYIIAQSVATHTGPDLIGKLFDCAQRSLSDDGYFLFSYIRDDAASEPDDGWHYPACVEYSLTRLVSELSARGLAAKPLPWFHPAASWIVAAKNANYLPSEELARNLSGYVYERPTSDKGYVTKK